MKDVTVKFNGQIISPTPTVSRGYQFLDFGQRFGQIETIDLACAVTGITNSYKAALNSITSIFSGQFKTLEVFEEALSVYKWDNVIVQDISVPENHFFQGTMAPYNVKLISYQIPSGVTDPSNEYSFSQEDNGIVNVSHKISARGVRTNLSPLDNAINFVTTFSRKNPFNNCVPAFIPNSSGVLLSISESTDRANGSYSITENYKYITGSVGVGYLKTTNLSIDESPSSDYINIGLDVNIQGSPVDDNLSEVKLAAQNIDLNSILSTDYGLNLTNIYKDTASITQNTGNNSIGIKINYFSGVNSDLSGYFDYNINFDRDSLTNISSWKVEGEFLSKGPLNLRKSQIATFKTANQGGGYAPYLTSLLSSSPLYAQYASSYPLTLNQLAYQENTGKATLRLEANFGDYDTLAPFIHPKYDISVEPSRWIYEMLPSANIEGHYIIQDLQMKNQAKATLSFAGTITGGTGFYSNESAMLDILSGIYIGSAFLVGETETSGVSSVSLERSFLGSELMGSGIVNSKTYGSINNGFVRKAGYKYGY